MFYFCSIPGNRRQSRVARPLVAALLVALLAALLTLAASAQQTAQQTTQVTDPGVQRRMQVMTAAKTALEPLAQMMAGRIRFDRDRAGQARTGLIRATRAIPRRFRHPHSDPLSRASPQIWANWDAFETRARASRAAARRLNTNSLAGLRRTLPRLMHSCLDCHQRHRLPP